MRASYCLRHLEVDKQSAMMRIHTEGLKESRLALEFDQNAGGPLPGLARVGPPARVRLHRP
ncbi:MAG: hypothetical protein MZU95_03400 [Desulfomicrobium escambiense]|nr:hypothetical protein [Desulfomicrobium escambiense]